MESNLVCNHTTDSQSWVTARRESNFLITYLVTERIDDTKSIYQLIKTIGQTRLQLYVFIKKKKKS